MSILLRFIGRMLFTPVWLIVMLIIAIVVIAMLAFSLVPVGCLFFAAVLGLGYWVRHDPEMGRAALQALACCVGSFAVLVAFQGMIWDTFCAVRDWGVPAGSSLQLRQPDQDFDENPFEDRSH